MQYLKDTIPLLIKSSTFLKSSGDLCTAKLQRPLFTFDIIITFNILSHFSIILSIILVHGIILKLNVSINSLLHENIAICFLWNCSLHSSTVAHTVLIAC